MNRIFRVVAPAVALTLAGCSGLPLDDGREAVRELGAARGVPLPDAGASPWPVPAAIDKSTAVQIALARNPRLRASLARLGVGAADIYEASRIANPVLGVSLLESDGPAGGRLDIYNLLFAFTDLLTLPARGRMARADYAALQHDVSAMVMNTALSARLTWLDYAAALEMLALQRQVAEAGIVSAELAERFRRAGNLTPRELAEQQAATAMLRADVLTAEARVAEARAAFAEALGISSGGDWQLSGGLGIPLADVPELGGLMDTARDTRLDLAAARLRADAAAARAGVENWSRWLDGILLGVEREREPDGTKLEGPALSLPLPVFDTGRGRVARAQAALSGAIAEVQRLELDVDNGLRLAHTQLDVARRQALTFRDVLLPARRRAVAEASAQYNFMLIGVFELLQVKRREIEASQGYVDSVKDYWRAHVALERALGRMLPAPEITPLRLAPGAGTPDAHGSGMPDGSHSGHDTEAATGHDHHDDAAAEPAPMPAHDHGRHQ